MLESVRNESSLVVEECQLASAAFKAFMTTRQCHLAAGMDCKT